MLASLPPSLPRRYLDLLTSMLAGSSRQDGAKIVAALQGRSWARQVAAACASGDVRFSQRYTAARPALAQPALRAAA